MANKSSSLQNFISQVNNRGLAKTNLFDVDIISPPCLRQGGQMGTIPFLLNIFCQSASFPPTSIGVRELKIAGPTYKRPYSIDYGGEGVSLTFLVDRKMELKAYFDVWMNKIINPFEYNANYDEGNSQYTTDIFIRQITEITEQGISGENGFKVAIDKKDDYFVKLENAFPRNIGMIELDSTAQNAIHKLTVNFAYRKVRFNSDTYINRYRFE